MADLLDKVKNAGKFENKRSSSIKGSSYPIDVIFEFDVGKSRIRYTTPLKLNDEFLDRLKIDWKFKFRVVLCRIRLFPTLVSKIKWLGSELPLILTSLTPSN